MQISEAFGDIAQTIAMLNPKQIVDMKASKEMSDRVEELVLKKKQDIISVDESIELERFLSPWSVSSPYHPIAIGRINFNS